MSGASLKEVSLLVLEYLELAESERAAWLEQLRNVNASLAERVKTVAEAHQADASFLESPVRLPVDDETMPHRIGPYRVIGELGSGGMGSVYLAVRNDNEFVQEVAIKLIRRGLDTDEVVARFRSERQILAGLRHRNIACLLDGGSTSDGRPYLVLERVRGERIDLWCQQRQLDLRTKLKLFQKICAAVSYAHQRLIIHRDLKPGNILVDEIGEPKLLDFGIAKLLLPGTVGLTRTSQALFTPEYASPEQLAGRHVSTATDVYSLGLILGELLTGARLRNSDKDLQPLSPDLRAIIRKSLAEDVDERYGSVEQLSADIEASLNQRPVSARKLSRAYQIRKYLVRHRRVLASASLVIIALSATTGWALWQNQVARAERALAQRRFADTRRLANTLLFGVHDRVSAIPGALHLREMLVSEALKYLNGLAEDAAGDRDLAYELAGGYRRLSLVQGDAFNSSRGDSVASAASLEKGIALLEKSSAAQALSAREMRMLTMLYADKARIQQQLGAADHGRALSLKALSLVRQLATEQPTFENKEHHAVQLLHASAVHRSPQLIDQGIAMLQESLAIFKELAATGPEKRTTLAQYAYAHKNMGAILGGVRRDYDRARDHYSQALTIDRRLLQAHPADVNLRYSLTASLADLAWLDGRQGRTASAVAGYQEVIKLREQLITADPSNNRAHSGLASASYALACVLVDAKRFDNAVSVARGAVKLREKLAGASPGVQTYSAYDLALARTILADALRGVGAPQVSRSRLQEALNLYQQALPALTASAASGRITGGLIGIEGRVEKRILECRTRLNVTDGIANLGR